MTGRASSLPARALAGPEPVRILISPGAAAAMDDLAATVYRARRTEWGGVLFGHLEDLDGRLIVVVEDATEGVCANATPTRVEILPESWARGEAEIRAAGRTPGLRIGTWHSHPRMSAIPSGNLDLRSWAGYARVAYFTGIIVNPLGAPGSDHHTCWCLVDGRFERIPSWIDHSEEVSP